MLRGNYRVLNRSPGRFFGGSTLADSRSNFNGPGASRNFSYPDGSPTALPLASIPDGTEPPYSWIIPQKSGALSSTTRVAGSGEVTYGDVAMGLACDAALDGSGEISFFGEMQLIVSMAAAITGTGEITTAALQLILGLAAAIGGDGGITAGLSAIGFLGAEIGGSGDVTNAVVNGPSDLSASINVTGDLLSTGNVGPAVWQHLIESGLSAQQIQRVLLAIASGKTSGMIPGTACSPEFLGADGSTVRVSGTLDSNGNRTSVVVTPGD